jgi:hypothetical protein
MKMRKRKILGNSIYVEFPVGGEGSAIPGF